MNLPQRALPWLKIAAVHAALYFYTVYLSADHSRLTFLVNYVIFWYYRRFFAGLQCQ